MPDQAHELALLDAEVDVLENRRIGAVAPGEALGDGFDSDEGVAHTAVTTDR
jgi:hypothetical protein